jgi:hypothetical protein
MSAQKKAGMVVYCTQPIDIWYGWTPLKQVMMDYININLHGDSLIRAYPPPEEILERWKKAQTLAEVYLGWTLGDIREGPWWCPLPQADIGVEFLIAWKRDQGGYTYIAVPWPLPWLETDRTITKAVDRDGYSGLELIPHRNKCA